MSLQESVREEIGGEDVSILKRRKKEALTAVAVPQTASRRDREYLYTAAGDALYAALREQVPVIDAAICKLVRLTGGFRLRVPDAKIEEELNEGLAKLSVCGTGVGIEHFISRYLDVLLTYGTAVGELVPEGRELALYIANPRSIALRRRGDRPMEVEVCKNDGGSLKPLSDQARLLMTALDPSADALCGNSLLKGLPFVSSVLLTIFEAVNKNWERVGNIRYSVNYKPKGDSVDAAYARERAMDIAKEWSLAMNSDSVKDFISVGDVEIKVIGSDSQILDSQIPVRQVLEQIVAKTGLPPFLLGLCWSSTERMAEMQTDLLTSELESYRRLLTPVIIKIASSWLRMRGLPTQCTVEWEDITLLDRLELSQARLNEIKAQILSEQMEKEELNGQAKELLYA